MRRRRGRGFTLVELMIVVAIIGVLASLAIYGVTRYVRHSKTAEPTRGLARIESGAQIQYQNETPFGSDPAVATVYVHTFCPNAGPTPTVQPTSQKVAVPAADWQAPGWVCLKFSFDAPLYYQYTYTSNGLDGMNAQYTALAQGDLDGNGLKSSYTLVGVGGTSGDAVRASFTIVNEDE